MVDHPDGEIRLTGHRIGLTDVDYYYNEGYSPGMLVEQFPTLPLALVHEAIAFYLANRTVVGAYAAQGEVACDRLRAEHANVNRVELRTRVEATRKAETR